MFFNFFLEQLNNFFAIATAGSSLSAATFLKKTLEFNIAHTCLYLYPLIKTLSKLNQYDGYDNMKSYRDIPIVWLSRPYFTDLLNWKQSN